MQTITPGQIRAARAILKITAQEVADAAGVGVATVRRAEDDALGRSTSKVVSLALRSALEEMGVEFIETEDGKAGVQYLQPEDRFDFY